LQGCKLSPYLGVEVTGIFLRPRHQLWQIADLIEAVLDVRLELFGQRFGMPLRLPRILLPFLNGMACHFYVTLTYNSVNIADDRVQPTQLVRISMKMRGHLRIALGSLQRIKSETKRGHHLLTSHCM